MAPHNLRPRDFRLRWLQSLESFGDAGEEDLGREVVMVGVPGIYWAKGRWISEAEDREMDQSLSQLQ